MRYVTLAVLATAFGASFALADTPPDDVPVKELHAWHTYTVEPDGRYIVDADHAILLRNEEGVHRYAQIPLSYSESRETLEVMEAYTETPDGRRIPVPADRIMTKESPVTMDAAMFADVKVKIIIFPDAEVKSTLHYKTRRTVKEPLFPGFVTIDDFVDPHELDDENRLTVYAAKGLHFSSDVVGFQGGVTRCPADQAGRTCYSWSAHNTVHVPPENGAVSPADYGQHVILSNFPNYEAIAAAYWNRAADKVGVSPAIQALTDDLTRGMTDPRAQAEALYNWVAHNIRYVAVSIGEGSVVPHQAEQILANRYGDCKDHVTLLQALLAARHIDSVGVLVGANRRWVLPSAPDNRVFNHIITYIPALGLYVDSTSSFSRFGQLPEIEVGKMALKTQPVPGARQLEPILSALSEGHMTTNVVMELHEDGGASGSADAQLTGSMEIAFRAAFARFPPGQEESIARSTLAQFNESGTGSFDKADPRDLTKAFSYQTKFTIPGLVNMSGPGAFPLPSGLRLARVEDIARGAPLPARKFPWICGIPGGRKEITRLTLPASMRITGTPKDVHVANDFGRYDAHYEYSGNVVAVSRDFEHTFARQPCNDDSYQHFRELATAIEHDLKAQFLFQ
jgi:transglutaminase-like putative cysteine protease